jgi:pimeloyl-ACP methyl ester carboxylesterase
MAGADVAAAKQAGSLNCSCAVIGEPGTYYDIIEPAGGTDRPPIVLIHGGAHTGACYLVTADGRPGWAQRFAARGYKVVVPDWPGCGRSGRIPYDKLDGATVCEGLGRVIASLGRPAVVLTHSIAGGYSWPLLDRFGDHISKVIAVAPGPPGNMQPVPEILAETEETIEVRAVAGGTRFTINKTEPVAVGWAMVETKLVGTSKLFPREHIGRYAASLAAVPPRLMYERLNIQGSQLKIRDMACLTGRRVMILTPTDDIDHPAELDRSIADWLNEAGALADFVYLGDRGIHGNGHMLMLERNSDQLADLIAEWIEGP